MNCATVGEPFLLKLAVKYLGGSRVNITPDEMEILMFALYCETKESGGIFTKATALMDGRLLAQARGLTGAEQTLVRKGNEGGTTE